jgi:replicative DNA helicase
MDLIRDNRLEQVALKILAENPDMRHLFSADMFSSIQHIFIFDKISKAHEENLALDMNLLVSYLDTDGKLRDVGTDLLSKIFSLEYSPEFIPEYAKKLSKLSLLRRSQTSLFTIADKISNYDVPDLISALDGVRQVIFDEVDITDEDYSLDNLLTQEIDSIIDGNTNNFIPTGFGDFDTLIGGLEIGNLAIVAARPSVGKTSLVLRWLLNMAKSGIRCEMYSFEMSNGPVVRRIMAMESGIPTHRLQKGLVSDAEKATLRKIATQLKPIPLSFRYAIGQGITELSNLIRLSAKVNATKVFAIDYVQQMEISPGNETQDLYRIAKTLKNLAVELDVVIILVSQLNRAVESRKNKHPTLSDLRQSGGLEESADLVIFPYREFYYSKDPADASLAELLVAKNRNGPIADFNILFNEESTNFYT